MGDAVLQANGLVKTFGQTAGLRGADLVVGRGEIVAVMGASGSGKSTLLHCAAGILPPDEGEVWFEGVRVDEMAEADRSRLRRTSFGFVFQFGQLIPELPALDNVALPLLLGNVSRREATTRAQEWLDRVGAGDVGRRASSDMSGGQAQRVALARAMAIGPAVLFADEPTGSLDSLAGEAVMELIVDAARDEGVSVVLVTHDSRVAAYSDREVVLRDGVTGSRDAA